MNPHVRETFWRYNFTTQAGKSAGYSIQPETQAGLEWSGAGCLAENTGLGSRGPEMRELGPCCWDHGLGSASWGPRGWFHA
ncbi:hypothetical protein TIFTF001_041022 [Ficus carica]|uniref:Uncharacterized protein n=1 Tax=Ficus carica TaxID=3494 RepID=A0AA87ZIX4_FICCA|nr:hypothetical protein TIFTF001_041017 [Ficus carica]GMN27343.1 hypothetical protein TIFTF001_041018 [Ficus carica]GMN27359.1 hypothetical protein TIFTF001_041021 [Ficus carica]GMN27371.1 hypothetical protein TIFTF001_041022 [Ficus carica]